MKYFRRGTRVYLKGDEGKEVLGHIQFQLSSNSLSPVSNQMGNIVGFFDLVDSTFKPAAEDNYYRTAREMF
ncbi:MAG: hypothetical protein Roseis2KO_53300 [Roseivirga sp.]